MEPIKLASDRKIIDTLVERKDGSMYDTYYKSLEELIHTYVDQVVAAAINNSFITIADADGLKRWEAFYTAKPFDMDINEYRRLLFILNDLTGNGPTYDNVLKLIQFFDPNGTFFPITVYPIYADYPHDLATPPFSKFWRDSDGKYFTDEMTIYDENSALEKINEFIFLDNDNLIYETSVLNVEKLTYRILLKTLLETLLPANVIFILHFSDYSSILFGGNA
jgi:hypothetical protein